ncbi:hypothetical protein M8J76_016218 [Diaphorina citri]|nr:hypothetical protein M8J76_016218 [Diaphorina citri]
MSHFTPREGERREFLKEGRGRRLRREKKRIRRGGKKLEGASRQDSPHIALTHINSSDGSSWNFYRPSLSLSGCNRAEESLGSLSVARQEEEEKEKEEEEEN